jgi:predicted outer membrane repeat protein
MLCSINVPLQGGGMYLHGMQVVPIASGASIIVGSTFSDNTASFGGAITCNNCRALLVATNITGNKAVSTAENSRVSACPKHLGAWHASHMKQQACSGIGRSDINN